MLGLAFVAVGSFCRRSFASASFVFALQALSSLAPMSFPHAGASSEVTTPWLPLLLPPSLQKGGLRLGAGRGGLEMPFCCFPRVFFSSRSTFVQREGWRSLWSLVRCTRARFCLLSSFVDWGSGSWLSCGGLLLPALSRLALSPHLCMPYEVMGREGLRWLTLFSVASPASSLHALRGDEAGESSEFRSS